MNNPLVQPDPGLFIWTLLTFLVLVALLTKFAWRPLLAALESRQEAIRKSLDDAQQAKAELERLHQESAQIMRQARAEADQIISGSRADAERLKEDIRQKAKADAEGIVRNAGRQIQLEAEKAVRQLRHEAVDLSVAIASKLIRRNLSKEDNEKLIEEAIDQVEKRH
jgi:F-type H+-transporting ATPase subunit b